MARTGTIELDQLHVAYSVDALLHTMRAIARHEEQLCSAMHAIQRMRTVDAQVREELLVLLHDLPAETYQQDRDAVLAALEAAAPVGNVAGPKKVPAGGRRKFSHGAAVKGTKNVGARRRAPTSATAISGGKSRGTTRAGGQEARGPNGKTSA